MLMRMPRSAPASYSLHSTGRTLARSEFLPHIAVAVRAPYSGAARGPSRTPRDRPPGPEQRGPGRVNAVAPAIEVCWTECPVRPTCAQEALNEDVHHGIWGGVDLADGRRGRLAWAKKALRGSAATPAELDYPGPSESSSRRTRP